MQPHDDFAAFANVPGLYVMSMFSWYWVLVLTQNPRWKEWAVIAAAFAMALPAEDFTRDFVLLSLPAVLFHLERIVRRNADPDLIRLAPLTPFHFQIAQLGQVFSPESQLFHPLSLWIRNL